MDGQMLMSVKHVPSVIRRPFDPFTTVNFLTHVTVISVRQPPSLRDSASHILFRCVLDLERFELTCYTTYSQYKFAVTSGRVDELHLLPPHFPESSLGSDTITIHTRTDFTIAVRAN